MAITHDPALRESSLFIHVLELVFRKLIRLLIGKMSLRKIQEMIQVIFVEEAEAILKQKNPGKSVALADLAILADTDTRTIKKTRTYSELSRPLHEDSTFLSQLAPEISVLDNWQNDANYVDPETGEPMILKITGDEASFESLVRDHTSTNGVVIDKFLKHLEEAGSVEILPGGEEVRFVFEQYVSFASSDEMAGLKIGLAAISNLLDTITHNLRAPDCGEDAFYQRGCWTTRLDKEDRRKLRELTAGFLLKSDEEARQLIGQYEQKSADTEQITAGISMFYFEEDKAA